METVTDYALRVKSTGLTHRIDESAAHRFMGTGEDGGNSGPIVELVSRTYVIPDWSVHETA
jgi:hypothetical protein